MVVWWNYSPPPILKNKGMTQYINKGDLVAEIESYISNYKDILARTDRSDEVWVDFVSMVEAKIDVLQHLLIFFDTLDVKEVDLDGEVEKCLKQHQMLAVGKKDFTEIAKHFYELGLKVAQKGE